MMLWLGKDGRYRSADLEPLKGANWYIVDLPVFELTEGVKLYFSRGHTTGHMTLAVKISRVITISSQQITYTSPGSWSSNRRAGS